MDGNLALPIIAGTVLFFIALAISGAYATASGWMHIEEHRQSPGICLLVIGFICFSGILIPVSAAAAIGLHANALVGGGVGVITAGLIVFLKI